FVLGLTLILLGLTIQKSLVFASQESLEKDSALEELQSIKENQNVFESQLTDLLEKSLAIENKLESTQKRLNKIKQVLKNTQTEILTNKIIAEQMRLERKRIIAELYILTDDPLYYVLLFLNTEQFMAKMHGKDEDSIVISEKIKKVLDINDFLVDLSEEQERLSVKQKSYQEQTDKLANEAAQIQAEIVKREGTLAALGERRFSLEKYLIGLKGFEAKNHREFITWNKATGPYFEFVGGGTEHGLGLSQYGAKGLAQQGKNHYQILSHYYQ
ncbi:unnamed protein product, partial [marine sediment metagenome]